MGKILAIIGALLATLIVVAIILTSHEVQVRDAKTNVAMFDIAPQRIDRITIEDSTGGQTLLVRSGQTWTLPDLADFPADGKKVEDTLDRLLAIKKDLPVASDEDALIRFKLAGDDFERRITLARGDEILATLYLGIAEGPRQVRARRADENAAYAVAFGLYDASTASDDWTDKAVLQVATADVAAIEVDELRLVPAAVTGEPAWRLDGAGTGQTLNPTAAARLAGLLAELRIESMTDSAGVPDYGLDAPLLTLTLTRRNGETIDYRLGKAKDGADYILKVSTWPQHFDLSSYSAHQLTDAARRETLLAKPAQHAAAPVSN